jgi:hypothetical protein
LGNLNANPNYIFQGCLQKFRAIVVELMKLAPDDYNTSRNGAIFCRRVIATNQGKGGYQILGIFLQNLNAAGINTFQDCLQNFRAIVVELVKLAPMPTILVEMALFFAARHRNKSR